MSTLSPDWWQAVSSYLDQALEMPDEERAAWLASLREQNPVLAANLQKLLDEHRILRQERFLEQAPVPLHGQSALGRQPVGAYTLHSPIGQGSSLRPPNHALQRHVLARVSSWQPRARAWRGPTCASQK